MKQIITLFFLLITSLHATQSVVLISGGTGGIGVATAKAFQQEGWSVWVGYRNAIPQCLKDLENIHFLPLDVTDNEQIQKGIEKILQEEGKIDALVNNAGYGLVGADECATIEEAQKIFDVNFFGAYRLALAVIPAMRAQKSGHIINISSTSGVRAVGGLGLYAASKFALEGLSESLAVTLSPWNIQVSIVQPGSVNNDWILHAPKLKNNSIEPIYSKLEVALISKLSQLGAGGQNCDEIGSLIVKIAKEDRPHMRYQTSDKVTATVAKKLVDVTGNVMRDEQILFFNSLVN